MRTNYKAEFAGIEAKNGHHAFTLGGRVDMSSESDSKLVGFFHELNDGIKSYNNDDYDNAIFHYTEAIRADVLGNRNYIYVLRGLAYAAKKDEKKALNDMYTAYEKGFELFTKNIFDKVFNVKPTKDGIQIAAENFFTSRGLKVPSNQLRKPWKTVLRIVGASLGLLVTLDPLTYDFNGLNVFSTIFFTLFGFLLLPYLMRKFFPKLRVAGKRGKESNIPAIIVAAILGFISFTGIIGIINPFNRISSNTNTVSTSYDLSALTIGDTVRTTKRTPLYYNWSLNSIDVRLDAGTTLVVAGSVHNGRICVEYDGEEGWVNVQDIEPVK